MDRDQYSNRRKQFKSGIDVGEIRRRREDDDLQIRKSEKADLLKKKRQMTVTLSPTRVHYNLLRSSFKFNNNLATLL